MNHALRDWIDSGDGLLDIRRGAALRRILPTRCFRTHVDHLNRYLHMLPARNVRFALLASEQADLDQALLLLKSKGWKNVFPAMLASRELVEYAETLLGEAFARNDDKTITLLFQPSPFFVKAIGLIESIFVEEHRKEALALDLGCGQGRDSIWLASKNWVSFPYVTRSSSESKEEKSKIAWNISCVDAYPLMLEKLLEAAKTAQCKGIIHPFCSKILGDGKLRTLKASSSSEIEESTRWADAKYEIVFAIRFLQKMFFPQIRNLTKPSGFVLYSTFLEGTSFPRKEARLLERDELSREFGETNGFEIFLNEVTLTEDGRELASILARKRG